MVNYIDIFVDTSGFKAVYDFKDDFHKRGEEFFTTAKLEKIQLVTSNFILDETFTLIRSQMGKVAALTLREDFLASTQRLKIVRIGPKD